MLVDLFGEGVDIEDLRAMDRPTFLARFYDKLLKAGF